MFFNYFHHWKILVSQRLRTSRLETSSNTSKRIEGKNKFEFEIKLKRNSNVSIKMSVCVFCKLEHNYYTAILLTIFLAMP